MDESARPGWRGSRDPPGDGHLIASVQEFLSSRAKGLPPSVVAAAAWDRFYARYAPVIRGFAIHCGATRDELDECCQEVWNSLLRCLVHFRVEPGRAKFRTWLWAVVKNKVADLHLREQRQQRSRDVPGLQHLRNNYESPADIALRDEKCERIRAALHQLRSRISRVNCEMIRMRWMDGQQPEEIARTLGLRRECVWYRLARLKRTLRAILDRYAEDG